MPKTLAALAALLVAVAPARAHVTLQSNLDTAQEVAAGQAVDVPPGTNPRGTATTLVLENDNAIEYQIAVQELSGAAVAAHIHLGAPGVSGGIEVPLDQATLAGTTPPLTDEQLRALFAGNLYLNVHTARNPLGEIRGQIVPPAPACDCDTLSRPAFKKCVTQQLKGLEKAERKSEAAKALKRAVKKASCGRTKGPKKAVACCLPVNAFENIVTDTLCAAVPEKACVNGFRGRSGGAGSSCFQGNPCSPSGAFLDGAEAF